MFRALSLSEWVDEDEVLAFLDNAFYGTYMIDEGTDEFAATIEAIDQPIIFPGPGLLCGAGFYENLTAEGVDCEDIDECIIGSVRFKLFLTNLSFSKLE